ncbi:formyltransferase family protein [Lysinibacillus fusiformis]|uniref:formyltransferase family protein n=1 Tax=Lysinibacillus fusiformis TaxID=28031 RepID=UPI002E1A269B|nr:formyltransferase family protein [Lysinibacillus fusiformis]MED4888197.1 formyltransferase family protein [Lysinibacillus fusiformis]
MIKSEFEQVVVIGSGTMTSECVKILQKTGLPIIMYDSNFTEMSKMNKYSGLNVSYMDVDKETIFTKLLETTKKSLVCLVVCNYLIPTEIIRKENLSIINYHNALLPNHRGRNAESWVLYEQEPLTGVTWHFVDRGIDTGDIIAQKEIKLHQTMTALSLLKLQNQIALDTFKAIIGPLLEECATRYKQPTIHSSKLHLSKKIPNDGFLDFSWGINKIWAFIRAMDYGALRTMGHPKVKYNEKIYTWRKATLQDYHEELPNIVFNEQEDYILINKNGRAIKLDSIREVGGNRNNG